MGGAVTFAAALPVTLGLLVALRSAQVSIGMLLVCHGASVALIGLQALDVLGGGAGLLLDQLAQGAWVLLFVWSAVMAHLFPDGALPSPRWRWWLGAEVLGVMAFVVGAVGNGETFSEQHPGQAPPLGALTSTVSAILGTVGLVALVCLVVGAGVAVVVRLRMAHEDARTRLLWLVWGAWAVPVSLVVAWANHFLLGDQTWLVIAALGVGTLSVPLTVAVATLRHRLFDIRVVLSRTVTATVMTGAVLVMYASVLEAVRRLGGDSTVGGLLAVAVVAVVIHPAHSWVRQRVERRVHGYRGDPHRALRMLADTTETAPQETLTASISATIAEAVRVDWARIDTGSGVDDGTHRFPLEHRGEVIGSLVVASPPGGRFGAEDLALLRDLARYAAVVVFADRHHGALRDSRARIVAAREEERRRLRRDLHDGIGPSLAAVVLKLNAAETRTDAQERHAILKEARSEVKEAIDEVRRLVDDLRPPAIDEVGLLAAIRQRALGLSEAVVFEVRGPSAMPDLPAAVETAAFRIAAEAMTNVARHASATRCEVDITITGDEFAITVTDNGRGAASTVRSGMGWESMRERAAELGGSCTLTNGAPGTGLSVHAVLPHRPSPGHLAEAGERA